MSALTLVTGAAGFAGSHLLDLLVAQGREVVGWHRPGTVPQPRNGVRWRGVELLDGAVVRQAVAADRPDRVFHCAGVAHVGDAWERSVDALTTNVRGTHLLLDALARSNPDARVLITSSALVYAPSAEAIRESDPLKPNSPYGVSKLAQEMVGVGATDGPRVWIARPFNHFGPRQAASFVSAGFAWQVAEIEAGRRAPEIRVGNLEARRDLTDVRDTVRAYDSILERGTAERPYNVCSNRALQVQGVLDALLSRARVPIKVVVDPARYRPNDTPIVLGDHQRITDELGWAPAIPLDQTLDDLLAYWRGRVASA
jgi:GDP-4-dehydro-6-deoxy-D-mannose reductase